MVVYLDSVSPHGGVGFNVGDTPLVFRLAAWALQAGEVHESLAEGELHQFLATLALEFEFDLDGRGVNLYHLVCGNFFDYFYWSSFGNGKSGKGVVRGAVQFGLAVRTGDANTIHRFANESEFIDESVVVFGTTRFGLRVAAGANDDALIIEGQLQDGGVSAIAVVGEERSALVLHEDLGLSDGGVGLYLDIAALTPANGLTLVFFIIRSLD